MAELSRLQNDVLQAISQKGDWISRSEIVRHLGKKRFSQPQQAALDFLSKNGYIQAVKVPGGSIDGYVWRYKLKSQNDPDSESGYQQRDDEQ